MTKKTLTILVLAGVALWIKNRNATSGLGAISGAGFPFDPSKEATIIAYRKSKAWGDDTKIGEWKVTGCDSKWWALGFAKMKAREAGEQLDSFQVGYYFPWKGKMEYYGAIYDKNGRRSI